MSQYFNENPYDQASNSKLEGMDSWTNEATRSTSGSPNHNSNEFDDGKVAGMIGLILGLVISGVFYGAVSTIPYEPLERYFLGHPVAIAATILFWIAITNLMVKWWNTSSQWRLLRTIQDNALTPPASSQSGPASEWMDSNHAGRVAKSWLESLAQLSSAQQASHLVRRLRELLTRQTQRGTSKHLADDLREISSRDADTAHDSLGLVRIIVWAIPMLGFLGTVIGITQTLGGLDFTDGAAAVDRLKSGLYVAFDTTALGLVLSVVAIFVQFPVERSEQRLLAEVDRRVGHLTSTHLPSDSTADNQVALVADLCAGIRAAVAESLAAQTKLWRSTIDEAQQQWQELQQLNVDRIADAFEQTLAPALRTHAKVVAESAVSSTQSIEAQTKLWQETLSTNAAALAMHHQKMIKQGQQIADSCESMAQSGARLAQMQNQTAAVEEQNAATIEQARSLAMLQQSLDSNLARLEETNHAIDRSVQAAGGGGIAEAMKTLAIAVDLLSRRLPSQAAAPTPTKTPPNSRRAA